MDAKPSNWTLRRRPPRLSGWPPSFLDRKDRNETASSIPGPGLHRSPISVQAIAGGVTALERAQHGPNVCLFVSVGQQRREPAVTGKVSLNVLPLLSAKRRNPGRLLGREEVPTMNPVDYPGWP